MSDDELEQLREATESGTRGEETAPAKEFPDKLADTLSEIEDNRGSRVVTANSPDLWALFNTLDENPDRRRELFENLDLDVPDDDKAMNRSAVLKRLVRVGLSEADEDLLNSLKEAKTKTATTEVL